MMMMMMMMMMIIFIIIIIIIIIIITRVRLPARVTPPFSSFFSLQLFYQ